jgi:hypothetical protein
MGDWGALLPLRIALHPINALCPWVGIDSLGYRVSSNNEACYAATHSARQPEIALNSLVGVGAMTKTKKSIGGVVVSVLALCVVRMLPLKLAQSIL